MRPVQTPRDRATDERPASTTRSHVADQDPATALLRVDRKSIYESIRRDELPGAAAGAARRVQEGAQGPPPTARGRRCSLLPPSGLLDAVDPKVVHRAADQPVRAERAPVRGRGNGPARG